MISDKEIRTAIWKERLPSATWIITAVVLVAFAFVIILQNTPAGPTREIAAKIESFGATHNGVGSGIYLVCVLDNGKQVRVYLDNPAPFFQKGQMIKLRELTSFLSSGKKYEFVYSGDPKVNIQAK